MFLSSRWVAVATLVFTTAAFSASPDFYVHDGDTVVFYGDSITHQRLYTVFAETFVLTRFPRIHASFFHSGWGGDRVSGGSSGPIELRLQRDVFAHHATVITIMLGMNDAEYRPFDPGIFDKFTGGYLHILDTIRANAPEARVTLLEPSPYDDFTKPPNFAGGYNSVLLKYGEFVREIGTARGLTVANLNAPVVALLKAANSVVPKPAQGLIADRVHPSPGVHVIMAEALLRAWHAPSLVTAVEIDGSTGNVVNAENTTVNSAGFDNGITWTQLDKALPVAFETDDETIDIALRYSDFTQTLNQEILKVTDLSTRSYRLLIDDEMVGTFDARQLANGVNLALLPTPMSRQAKTVLDLTYRHNHLIYARNMMVENALKEYHPAQLDSALDAMDSLHEEVVSLQRAAAIPKPHRYRLIPVP